MPNPYPVKTAGSIVSASAMLEADTVLVESGGNLRRVPSLAVSSVTGSAPAATRAALVASTPAAVVFRIGHFTESGDTVWFKRDATGTALTTADGSNWSPDGRITIVHFGAALDGVTDDTLVIQAAINAVYNAGGGEVLIDGPALVSASAEVGSYFKTNDTAGSLSDFCIVLREGVIIRFGDSGSLNSEDPTKSVLALYDMGETKPGGVISDVFDWRITNAWVSSGAGHGVVSIISDSTKKNSNMTLKGFGVKDVGSYGFGLQYGGCDNSHLEGLKTLNTGADGYDLKCRGEQGDAMPQSYINNCEAIQHGQRTNIKESAGFDIRGNWIGGGLRVTDFSLAGQDNVGLRHSSGVANGDDFRPASSFGSISDVYIDSGDPTDEGISGYVALSSESTAVQGLVVKNCFNSVIVTNASSGIGDTSDAVKISNLSVEGCFGLGIDINSNGVSISNASIRGASDVFNEDRLNITAAQTVFNLSRPHDILRLFVTKNGVVLSEGADYTVTDSETITLASGVLVTDEIVVTTNPTTAADVSGTDCSLTNVYEVGADTKLIVSEPCTVTGGNLRPSEGVWTPEVADAITGGNLASTGDIYGRWARDGRNVTLTVTVNNIDTTGMTGSNDLYFRNLPFDVSDLDGRTAEEIYFTGSVRCNVVTFTGSLSPEIRVSRPYVRLAETRNNAGLDYVQIQDLTSGSSDISFQITYETDDA